MPTRGCISTKCVICLCYDSLQPLATAVNTHAVVEKQKSCSMGLAPRTAVQAPRRSEVWGASPSHPLPLFLQPIPSTRYIFLSRLYVGRYTSYLRGDGDVYILICRCLPVRKPDGLLSSYSSVIIRSMSIVPCAPFLCNSTRLLEGPIYPAIIRELQNHSKVKLYE